MCPIGDYATIMRESKDPRVIRLRLAIYAKEHGIAPTARAFLCAENTVRTWLRRYNGTLESLQDRSRAPLHPCRQIQSRDEQAILDAYRRFPVYGAAKIKALAELRYAIKTIRKVMRKHGLLGRWHRKKYQTKHCLREIKKRWPLWKQITMDTKDLCDMPEYWVQAKRWGLPQHQYTAREVSTGVLWLGFADELALSYSTLMAQRMGEHLRRHGVSMPEVTIQTDNGSEFIGSWQAREDSAFTKAILGECAHHRTIPPGQHRWQADVETVHSIMEREFYLERFSSRQDFLDKARTYQNFFNYARPNSGKENKSPWELFREKDSTLKPDLLYLPPVFLDELFVKRLRRSSTAPSPLQDVGYLP